MSTSSIYGVWQVTQSTNPLTTDGGTQLFPAGYFVTIQQGQNNITVTGYPNNGWWSVSVQGDSEEVYGTTGPSFTSFFEVNLVDNAPEPLIMGSVLPAAGGSTSSTSSGCFLAQPIPPGSSAADVSSLSKANQIKF